MADEGYVLYKYLKDRLSPCRVNGSNSHVMIRCPYCGDSDKSSHSTHFYISLTLPHLYMCQRCGARGLFGVDTLNALETTDYELRVYVTKQALQKRKHETHYNTYGANFKTDIPPLNPDLFAVKVAYITNRLQCHPDMLARMRIIPGLREMMTHNRLHIIPTSLDFKGHRNLSFDQRVTLLDTNYVGMINHSHTRLVFRCIYPQSNLPRYRNIVISPPHIHADSFSVLAGSYNLMEDPEIHISEGMITLAGVNQYNSQLTPCGGLYVAGNSLSTIQQLTMWLIHMGYVNSNIHIWADQGITLKFWQKLALTNKLFRIAPRVTVYYNLAKDDFGYDISNIQPQSFVLKGSAPCLI
jgi:hypothetical protein